MSPAAVLPLTLAAVALAMLALWLVSLPLRNASIVDVFWGPGFVLVAAVALAVAGEGHPRRWLLLALVAVWGLRLGGYLLWRNAGKGEDFRYAAMRRRHGARFAWVSLGTVFGLQAALLWIVSMPVQVAMAWPGPGALGLLDAAGALVFATGLAFETVGDFQLARFKADPASRGRVMERGLWRYTRHPNYFGDFLVWWGIFLVACATPYGLLTLPAPALMSFLLLRVSGVALLERDIGRRRPEYADYARRTNAFFPGPPRPSPRAGPSA